MKKLIALAAALLAMLVLACACSSGTVDRTNQPVPQEAEETFIPVPTDWIVESLEGALWEDDRASLKVVREDEGYKVIIEWGSSAWESSVWIYSCTWDAEAHTLNAIRAMCETLVYDEAGNETRNTVFDRESEAVFAQDDAGCVVIRNAGDESLEGKTFRKMEEIPVG